MTEPRAPCPATETSPQSAKERAAQEAEDQAEQERERHLHEAVAALFAATGLTADAAKLEWGKTGDRIMGRLRCLADPDDPDNPARLQLKMPGAQAKALEEDALAISEIRKRIRKWIPKPNKKQKREQQQDQEQEQDRALSKMDISEFLRVREALWAAEAGLCPAEEGLRRLAQEARELAHQGASAASNDAIVRELGQCWRLVSGGWPKASAALGQNASTGEDPRTSHDVGPFPRWARDTMMRLGIKHPAIAPTKRDLSRARSGITSAVRRLRKQGLWQDVPGDVGALTSRAMSE